jgi:hypothetical protein
MREWEGERERLSGKEERKRAVGFGRGLGLLLLSRGAMERVRQARKLKKAKTGMCELSHIRII